VLLYGQCGLSDVDNVESDRLSTFKKESDSMFDQLFVRSEALTRQLSAPLVYERRQYLTHCAVQGMTKSTLEAKARLLLSIAEYLRLADRPSDTISLSEIQRAATRWSTHNCPLPQGSHAKRPREYFMAEAAKWLTFLNRLQTAPKPVTSCDHMLTEFRSFMEEDRGLSSATVKTNCSSVRPFLIHLLDGRRSLQTITVSDVDALLAKKVNEQHYARVSVRDYASSLRSFFRYAEMRGWCRVGIAASIMAPRVFKQETLPSGPTWDIVQEIVDATAGDHPIAIRDHAILMLLAVYGVRSREVARLQLTDIDWQRETIVFTRSKVARSHSFPLQQSVGAAIIRYLKEVRPKSPHRQVFLTRRAPVGPISNGAMWAVVSRQLRKRAPSLKHHGPHSIRHACATRLINQGLSLKEIGDHLGHRDVEATRIYAKVDLARLREVADFDLGELL
jgi:integrase/recombinase XerD